MSISLTIVFESWLPRINFKEVEAFEKEQINQQSKEDGWRGDWARSVKLICP
jgi:hypothetical protein